MTEIEQLKMKIGNLIFEYWQLLPEQKTSYTKYYQGIDKALEDWCLVEKKEK